MKLFAVSMSVDVHSIVCLEQQHFTAEVESFYEIKHLFVIIFFKHTGNVPKLLTDELCDFSLELHGSSTC